MKRFLVTVILSLIVLGAAAAYLFTDELAGAYGMYKLYRHRDTMYQMTHLKQALPSGIDVKMLLLGKLDADSFTEQNIDKIPAKGTLLALAADMPNPARQQQILKAMNMIRGLFAYVPADSGITRSRKQFQEYIKKKNGLENVPDTLPPALLVSQVHRAIPEPYRDRIFTLDEYRILLDRLPDKEFLRQAGELILNIQ